MNAGMWLGRWLGLDFRYGQPASNLTDSVVAPVSRRSLRCGRWLSVVDERLFRQVSLIIPSLVQVCVEPHQDRRPSTIRHN